jgi:hypothetical protein
MGAVERLVILLVTGDVRPSDVLGGSKLIGAKWRLRRFWPSGLAGRPDEGTVMNLRRAGS